MNYGVSQKQKRASEDRYYICHFGDFDYYSIFDGHGGISKFKINVVDFCYNNLHLYLETLLNNSDLDDQYTVCNKIKEAFYFLDKSMFENEMVSGCTCTAILVDNKRNLIYQINLGDSRSIIFNSYGTIISESVDHKPTDEGEKLRIINSGQVVSSGRVSGCLAVSRAFGDFYPMFKFNNSKYDPISSAVSVIPDVKVLDKVPCRIILTSDAPFERNFYDNVKLINLSKEIRSTSDDLYFVADNMVSTIDKSVTDDITIIYVEIL